MLPLPTPLAPLVHLKEWYTKGGETSAYCRPSPDHLPAPARPKARAIGCTPNPRRRAAH